MATFTGEALVSRVSGVFCLTDGILTSDPVNTVLLDLSGILFAVQIVVMFVIGPYADYGNWRPWILIGESNSRCLVAETSSRRGHHLGLRVWHDWYQEQESVGDRQWYLDCGESW